MEVITPVVVVWLAYLAILIAIEGVWVLVLALRR